MMQFDRRAVDFASTVGEFLRITDSSGFFCYKKMPSARQRASANAPDTSTVSLNEKILKECHDLYTQKEKGSLKKLLSLSV